MHYSNSFFLRIQLQVNHASNHCTFTGAQATGSVGHSTKTRGEHSGVFGIHPPQRSRKRHRNHLQNRYSDQSVWSCSSNFFIPKLFLLIFGTSSSSSSSTPMISLNYRQPAVCGGFRGRAGEQAQDHGQHFEAGVRPEDPRNLLGSMCGAGAGGRFDEDFHH